MLAPLAFLALLLGARALAARLCEGFTAAERRAVWLSFVLTLLGVAANIAVTRLYYEGGDMLEYHKYGTLIAERWKDDVLGMTPRVLELLFQQGGRELVPYGEESPTGSMHAVAAIFSFLSGGSLFVSCCFVAFGALLSRILVFRAFRRFLRNETRRPVLLASLFLPSVIFWSSGLLKEAVVLWFLGPLVVVFPLLQDRRYAAAIACAAVGVIGCGLFKPYLLPPYFLAAVSWWFVARTRGKGKGLVSTPFRLLLAVVATLGLLTAVASFFPRYDFTKIEDQVLQEQKYGEMAGGGSYYRLQGAGQNGSPSTMMLLAPFAVVTALFRPFILEARNPLALVNGLETAFLVVLLFGALRQTGFRGALVRARNTPLLAFCTVFTLVLALGVGFSTTNLGTLSRYRMPLIPFFVTGMLVLRHRVGGGPALGERQRLAV